MKKNKLNIYLSFIALTAAMIGCTTEAADNSSQSSSQTNRLPVDVKVVKASTLIQEETVAGSILPNKEVTIMSEGSRKITAVSFSDGSKVAKGQLLYKLDDSDVIARLKQVQAELSLAKLNETRLSQLLKNESVRQEEYDVAATKLKSLEASEEILQVELSKTTIRAPFPGVIGITKVEVGSLVSPGMPLVVLQEQGNIKIEFTIPEKYLAHVTTGKKIQFSTTSDGQKFTARISATESGLDIQSRAITVHAVAANHNNILRPGMSARVHLSTVSEGATGITLPTESLIPSAHGYSVFTVKNGLAKITAVTVGNRSESEALITSGINDGDTVMISNILRSGDGTPVQIVSTK
jgi:membrane fusion protein (multidrug efflux system)